MFGIKRHRPLQDVGSSLAGAHRQLGETRKVERANVIRGNRQIHLEHIERIGEPPGLHGFVGLTQGVGHRGWFRHRQVTGWVAIQWRAISSRPQIQTSSCFCR